jgi:hypothetical protein
MTGSRIFRRNARGEGQICSNYAISLCVTFFLEHNYSINRRISKSFFRVHSVDCRSIYLTDLLQPEHISNADSTYVQCRFTIAIGQAMSVNFETVN